MGNASGKEGEENGHVAAGAAAGVAGSAGAAARAPPPLMPPDAVMRELPPPVPYVFTPQVPVAPLHIPTEFSPVFNNSWINESDESTNNHPQEKGIPTLISWSQGGNEVFVEGSWDNWTSRRVLEKSGKDHTILLVLPSGVYHYRIIVDGEPKYVPELPHVADEGGQVANLLDVHDYIPESLGSVAGFDAPPSPEHSYDLQLPGDEEFAKEPPILPPQLVMSVLGDTDNSEEQTLKPKHVVLNHLYIEKGWGSQSLLALGVTHRFQSKYVSFVLYKPLRRSSTAKRTKNGG
uniref:Association with the SNF1 complex (ASC) domain-containing protein n=1 Tax=Oryza rufipogon TaxID=4529 RepID=A0A0E0PPB4_ORYRU